MDHQQERPDHIQQSIKNPQTLQQVDWVIEENNTLHFRLIIPCKVSRNGKDIREPGEQTVPDQQEPLNWLHPNPREHDASKHGSTLRKLVQHQQPDIPPSLWIQKESQDFHSDHPNDAKPYAHSVSIKVLQIHTEKKNLHKVPLALDQQHN